MTRHQNWATPKLGDTKIGGRQNWGTPKLGDGKTGGRQNWGTPKLRDTKTEGHQNWGTPKLGDATRLAEEAGGPTSRAPPKGLGVQTYLDVELALDDGLPLDGVRLPPE